MPISHAPTCAICQAPLASTDPCTLLLLGDVPRPHASQSFLAACASGFIQPLMLCSDCDNAVITTLQARHSLNPSDHREKEEAVGETPITSSRVTPIHQR